MSNKGPFHSLFSYTSYVGMSGTVLKESSDILLPTDFFGFPLSPLIAINVLFNRENTMRKRRSENNQEKKRKRAGFVITKWALHTEPS